MRVLIVRNNYNPKAIEASLLLEIYLGAQGFEYAMYDSDEVFSSTIIGQEKVTDIDQFDLAVVLGGDGTILRTAAQIKYLGIPILAINYGSLGFMANPHENNSVIPVVAAALAGDMTRELRTNLRVDVYCEEDGHFDFDAPLDPSRAISYFALNEVVLARGDKGRIIDFDYSIAGSHIATMRGDGIVVATATGSTAYALSAGGPLVAPGFHGLVVVPIAPHSLHSRAIVTGPSDVAEITLESTSANRQASMFIDGELVTTDSPIRRVVVSAGDEPTVLLRYHAETFYGHASKVFF